MHRDLRTAALIALSSVAGACVESEYEEDLEAIDTETDAFLDEEFEEDELVAESRPSELPPEGWNPPSPACPTSDETPPGQSQNCLAADKCFIFKPEGTDSLPGAPNSKGWHGNRGVVGNSAIPDPNICYAINGLPTATGKDIAPCGRGTGYALCGPTCW